MVNGKVNQLDVNFYGFLSLAIGRTIEGP